MEPILQKPCRRRSKRPGSAPDQGTDASAALNFIAVETGPFTKDAIAEACVFTDGASQALRLALRIATADLLSADL